ncbi:MAG: hypothetical protein NTW86_31865 [Candidatus Sumerlaeota bacterium]|nr:hypothetical protein [Candidatus Sumerlaeota bacterium]
MKTLTDIANRERLSTSQDVFWLFEIDWPDATRGYSTRPIELGGLAYKPWITGIERRATTPSDSLPPTEIPGERATIRLLNVANDAESLEILARRQEVEGRPCRLRLFFRDAAGEAGPQDRLEVLRGRVGAVRLGTTWAEIDADDFVRAAAQGAIGRLLDRSLFPALPADSVGAMAPWIFGRAVGAPLIPLRDGPTTRLRQQLNPEDEVARVDSLDGFPPAGLLQVGDELIRYSAVDEPAISFGSLTSPLERALSTGSRQAGIHGAGTRIRLVPEGGFEFLIADHPCQGVSDLRADGQWVDPVSYSLSMENVGGVNLQKAAFALWPTRLIAEAGPTRLALGGADVEGRWAVEPDSTALSPLAAVDADPLGSSAVIAASSRLLTLSFHQSLEQGERSHGPFQGARLMVRHWADRVWASSTQVYARIRKGALSVEALLPRPEEESVATSTPAHAHGDSILDTVEDLRLLFATPDSVAPAPFDSVQGEEDDGGALQWPNAARAIDGSFDTATPSYGGTATRNETPLVFRLHRAPQSDAAGDLRAAAFRVRCRAGDGQAHAVRLTLELPGLARVVAEESVGEDFAVVAAECRTPNLQFAHLIDEAAAFTLEVVDGALVEVGEAWLDLAWRARVAGQTEPLRQRRTGQVIEAAPLGVSLPVSMQTSEVDAAALANAFGGWGFFGSEEGWPRIEIEMTGPGESAQLHVVELAWAIDYRPRREARMATRLTATVDGLSAQGGLLENPADVVRFLLTDARAAGVEAARLDDASFAEARVRLESLGYRFAARLDRRERIERLLAAALFESRTELRVSGDRVRLALAPAEVERADRVFEFDETVLLESQIERRRGDARGLTNDLTILYAPDFSKPQGEQYRRSWRERLSLGANPPWGRAALTLGARWLGEADVSAAKDLVALHLARRSDRRWIATVATPPRAIHLDWGDPVALTHEPTGHDAAPGRIVGWTMQEPARLALEIELEAQEAICWAVDESTFLQPRGAGARLAIFVGGAQVARLESGGRLAIAGEAVEQALGAVRLGAAIEYNAESGRLYFGAGANGVFEAGFALDAAGNLLLRGELAEGRWLELTPLTACWRAALESVAPGIAGAAPLAVYDAASRELRLLGFVQEGL